MLSERSEPFDLSEYHKRQRGQSDREEYNQRKSKGHFFQMNIYVHAIKTGYQSGNHQNDGKTGHAFHDGVDVIRDDGGKSIHRSG